MSYAAIRNELFCRRDRGYEMNTFDLLSIVSCVTSTVTMIVVAMAMLPHVKAGAVIVRDAILWLALITVLAGLVWMAINQFTAPSNASSGDTSGTTNVSRPRLSFSMGSPNDDLYVGK